MPLRETRSIGIVSRTILSTEMGNYSMKENVSRLYAALEDNAKEAVKSLFISCNNIEEIMETLQMRFGNTKIILEKVIHDVRNLPNVNEDNSCLVEFATKLKNAISAI